MEKLTDILAMGGFATYVWPAYGIAAVVMLGLLLVSLRQCKRAHTSLSQFENTSHDET